MRALVVDDSRAIRSILRGMLGSLGFEVHEARHGREGLRRLVAAGPVDLALVDWNMPEMDGLAFVRAVRGVRDYDPMRLMMVTRESELDRVSEALEQGADEYLMKPFTEEMIRQKLELLAIRPLGAMGLPPRRVDEEDDFPCARSAS